MSRYIYTGGWTLLAILLVSSLKAQTLPELEVTREREFSGTALYGFMNGGSDLFLEYGFQSLRVVEVVYQEEEYTIEIYKMPTPEDAFGIYSLHTFKCLRADSMRYFDCLSAYQLQAAIGDSYVSIVFPSGSKKAKEGSEKLLQLYTSQAEQQQPALPAFVQKLSPPYSGMVKYLKGELAIANAYPALWPLFGEFKNYQIWLVKKGAKVPGKALVTFATPEAATRFTQKNQQVKISEKYKVEIDRQDEHTILLKEIAL